MTNPSRPATSVATSIADARKQADKYVDDDPTYAEMMLTYAALGELLEENRHINTATAATLPPDDVRQYEDDCNALVRRLIELEQPLENEYQQQWARWCTTYMNGGASDGT